MDRDPVDVPLVQARERKLLDAPGALEQVRDHLYACAGPARDSAAALGGQAAQAQRHSRELLADAARLTEAAERLVLEVTAMHGDQTPVGAAEAAEE